MNALRTLPGLKFCICELTVSPSEGLAVPGCGSHFWSQAHPSPSGSCQGPEQIPHSISLSAMQKKRSGRKPTLVCLSVCLPESVTQPLISHLISSDQPSGFSIWKQDANLQTADAQSGRSSETVNISRAKTKTRDWPREDSPKNIPKGGSGRRQKDRTRRAREGVKERWGDTGRARESHLGKLSLLIVTACQVMAPWQKGVGDGGRRASFHPQL